MVKLADFTPKDDSTQRCLDEGEVIEQLRPYLGMSMLGEPCKRYLWYYFRWMYKNKYPKRVKRIFEHGDREEVVAIKRLRKIGVFVSGGQTEIVGAHGHAKGHIDGVAEGVKEAPNTPHLFECKSHNAKNFNALIKSGVKTAHPKHYAQMQRYMKGTALQRALYYAMNKDDDSIYIERVNFDKDEAARLIETELAVVESDQPFARIGNGSPSWYQCRFCSAREVCYNMAPMEKNCRTCIYGGVADFGQWKCTNGRHNIIMPEVLTEADQRRGCKLYEPMQLED